ncbi:MAG: ABC transporter permease [Armatimonadota bacterium]
MLVRTWAVARKEVIQILRDWRTLAVVIILPVLMLVLYGYAINMDVKHLRTAVLDQDGTPESRALVRVFQNSEYFRVVRFLTSPAEVDHVIRSGLARVVITIPRGYARDIASGRRAQVQVIVDGSDSATGTAAVNYASGAIQAVRAQCIAPLPNWSLAVSASAGLVLTQSLVPVDYRPRVWYNPELRSTNFIVPGLIAVILMMLSALLTSMTVVREGERGTIEQLVVSPVMPHELIIGKLIPYVAIAFLDIALVTAAGRVLFDVPFRGSAALLIILSGAFLVATLGIGLLISTASESQQTAMTIAMMTTMLPSVLLSGFLFPIASMPKAIQAVTYLIPARYFLVVVRGILLKSVGPEVLWKQGLLLIAFGTTAICVSAARFKKRL